MCGIAGIVAFEGSPPPVLRDLETMCETIRHRGPDDAGYDIRDAVGLGMRRLAIIDVQGGRQPLLNEDGTVRAVYNGEIYNFRDLRRDLEAKGHRFASATDGEVIVHLWEEYGDDFPRHLNGMFAIALHDVRRRRVLLVRDRLGIKPLYYHCDDRQLIFGSEVKVLLASGRVDKELDLDALGQFFAWEYVPGRQTLLQSVRKLAPGEMLQLDLDASLATTRVWWDIPAPGDANGNGSLPKTAGEWEDAIEAKLGECVRRRLISDVPLGAFLSGGVDSSLVVAAMGPARTFSIGFDDPSYNEVAWASRVARHLNVNHSSEIIRPTAVDLFDHLMQFMDDPIGDFSIFPTYLVSRFARQDVTVVLSGDGGDELFGGYETYVAQQKARTWNRIPRLLRARLLEPVIHGCRPRPQKKGLVNKAKRFVEGLEHDDNLGHARWRLFVGELMRQNLFTPEAQAQMQSPVGAHVLELFDAAGPRKELERSLYVDVKSYLCDNILVKVDRMSMACSLEARVPFLDHEMVELAFQMPSRLKVASGRTKVLLKKLAAKRVPRDCVYRPKQGFSIPMKNWLNTTFRSIMEELLAPERLAREGIFRVPTVERLKQEHVEGKANHSHILWSLIVFQDWRRRWRA